MRANAAQIAKKNELLWQMLAIHGIDGFTADDDFLASMEPLILGEMTPDEHERFLAEKFGN